MLSLPVGGYLVNLDSNFDIVTIRSRLNNGTDRLGNAALLADHTAHIPLCNMQVVYDSAIFQRGISSDIDSAFVFYKSSSNRYQ